MLFWVLLLEHLSVQLEPGVPILKHKVAILWIEGTIVLWVRPWNPLPHIHLYLFLRLILQC